MYNYLQLKQETAKLTQHVSYDSAGTATYDDNFLAKAGTWLNLEQEILAQIYDYWIELHSNTPHDFTTVDGTEKYNMPADFDKPYRVADLTNKRIIDPVSEEEYIDGHVANIADSDTGKPAQYRLTSVSNRLKQMAFQLTPDDAYSIRVWYKVLPTAMSENTHYPFIRNASSYFIYNTVGWALKWEKKDQAAIIAWQQAERALNILLANQSNKIGTDYQHRIVSKWASAHRI